MSISFPSHLVLTSLPHYAFDFTENGERKETDESISDAKSSKIRKKKNCISNYRSLVFSIIAP